MHRKLYRSATDIRLAGVCGGLGEYLGIDSTVIRLSFVLLTVLGGHGLLLYLILWLIMPVEPVKPTAPAGATQETRNDP